MSNFTRLSTCLAAAVFFFLCPFVMYGQGNMQNPSGTMPNDQSNMGQQTMGTHHMINVTGCLKKGSEAGGYYVTDQSGATWELSSKSVNLGEHVGHTVSVAGHEMSRSKAEEAKTEASEKSEAGGNKYHDLKVSQLKMVSESCSQ